MNKDKLIAQRDEIIRSIELTQRNEKKRADFQDANNLRNYQHALKIREMKYENDVKLKRRSDFFTDRSIESARAQQKQQEFETHQLFAFENEDWSKSINYFKQAKDQGYDKYPGRLELLLGISYFEISQYQQALVYLNESLEIDQSTSAAEGWINYINDILGTQNT